MTTTPAIRNKGQPRNHADTGLINREMHGERAKRPTHSHVFIGRISQIPKWQSEVQFSIDNWNSVQTGTRSPIQRDNQVSSQKVTNVEKIFLDVSLQGTNNQKKREFSVAGNQTTISNIFKIIWVHISKSRTAWVRIRPEERKGYSWPTQIQARKGYAWPTQIQARKGYSWPTQIQRKEPPRQIALRGYIPPLKDGLSITETSSEAVWVF